MTYVYAGAADWGARTPPKRGRWGALAAAAGAHQSGRTVRDGLSNAHDPLAIDPTKPHELYAGVAVGGLVRSLDGGATWRLAMLAALSSAQGVRADRSERTSGLRAQESQQGYKGSMGPLFGSL
jgi:hypothetical protein